MNYDEGDQLIVTVNGADREVEFVTETADGLLLVRDGHLNTKYTVGAGEVKGR